MEVEDMDKSSSQPSGAKISPASAKSSSAETDYNWDQQGPLQRSGWNKMVDNIQYYGG